MKSQVAITETDIVDLLLNVNHAVEWAVCALYNRQTAEERSAGETVYRNGMGFNGWDAKNGTYWAKWILSGRTLNGRFLEQARRTMPKYARQLVEVANSNS